MSILDAVSGFLKKVPIVGDVIGAASQLAANKSNQDLQREFATHGIRWKVEDAKAAGVHPLFALGASTQGFSPSTQPLFQGQNLSRSMSAAATEGERRLLEAQIRSVEAAAQKDEVLAAAAASEAHRAEQSWLQSQSIPMVKEHRMPDPLAGSRGPRAGGVGVKVPASGQFQMKPAEVISSGDSGSQTTAGPVSPGWTRYQLSRNFPMLAPQNSEGWSEALGELPITAIPGWIAENIREFGPDWPWRFIKWSVGADPSMVAGKHYRDPVRRVARGRSGTRLPPVRRP